MDQHGKAATGGERVYPATQRRPIRERVRRFVLHGLGAGLLLGVLATCVTTPLTGRRALNLFSVEQEAPLGTAAYEEILAGEQVVTSGPEYQMVQRIHQRLVAAVAPEDPGFEWETRLIHAPNTANAFCLPGGKMAVYTGILPFTRTEAALAAVMGHEIGHALARHGTERLSQHELAGSLTGVGLSYAGLEQYAQLAGPIVSVLLLPYGRRQELEADHMGLILMARAGYDPNEAIGFWERMDAASGGGGSSRIAEWLSTHPTGERRIAQIRSLLPEVMPIYEAARSGQTAQAR